jgi:hypothetical protein
VKPVTLFRLGLLLPYALWTLSAGIVALVTTLGEVSETVSNILMPLFFYAFGILFWLIPYTLLTVGLWIVSREKPISTLKRLALGAPLLLAMLMTLEGAGISLLTGNISTLQQDLPGQLLLFGGFSLGVGYLCVGLAFVVFKILETQNLIAIEQRAELAAL